ncbi:clostripain-related cysteine peptidase [Caballeronia sp. LZ035]|uniref:clostripain-related cysteine peptidase n=1 Tax=Caballeronia sp. LZ035 TaxID=3038568 RepID=UPI00285F6E05|nr:clostripain-related cysteine peptidase [Caballeronia sp. LZ035]MDR5755723.1 clostripain-related cysteine peptidase [Caballeronia sp. LZ035]
MRKNSLAGWLLVLLITTLLTACGGSNDTNPAVDNKSNAPAAKVAATTVMIYLDGSDLESKGAAATANLKQMMAAASSDEVNVIITTGGADKANPNDPVSDWRTLRRYALRNGKLELLADLGKKNMVEPGTLTDFIVWAKTSFPANAYHLIFWDHGAGYAGYGVDENFDKYQSMSLPVMRSALEQARAQTGILFDMIGFDACLMASAEVAHTFAPYARYLAASEELEPGSGWDYKAVLSALAHHPGMSSEQLGRIIADSYVAFQQQTAVQQRAEGYATVEDEFLTFSVIDLSRMDAVARSLKSFSMALTAYVQQSPENWVAVAKQRALTPSFGGDTTRQDNAMDAVDLGVFADRLASNNIVPEASRVLSAAVRQAVMYRANGAQAALAAGMNIYFPLRQMNDTIYKTKFAAMDFPEEYKSFLRDYIAYPSEQPDVLSVDISRSTATVLNASVNSTFGVQFAMLALTARDPDDSHVIRITAAQPIDLGPASHGISASMDRGWVFLNGHIVSIFKTSEEERVDDGTKRRFGTYSVPAFLGDTPVSLIFERNMDSDEFRFVETWDDSDGPGAGRLVDGVNRETVITLADIRYDVSKKTYAGMVASSVSFAAADMGITLEYLATNGNPLHLITQSYSGSTDLSAALPVNF